MDAMQYRADEYKAFFENHITEEKGKASYISRIYSYRGSQLLDSLTGEAKNRAEALTAINSWLAKQMPLYKHNG